MAAHPSERRNRRLDEALDRTDPRLSTTNDHPTGAVVDTRHLATPRGADDVPSGARIPGLALTLGMFSPDSTGLESGRAPPVPLSSLATVNSNAARDNENIRGISAKQASEGCVSGGKGFFLVGNLPPREANP